MITISITSRDHKITGFTVYGHAGYADHGQDIICAAVSALTQSVVLWLGDRSVITSDDGWLQVQITTLTPKVQAVLECMLCGLKEIEKQYGEYVCVVMQ